MHGPINVKSPNNISKWQMGFNSAFEGLNATLPRNFLSGFRIKILQASLFATMSAPASPT
jgi:hypothetical protein